MMKFRNRGMIRIRTPASRATMAGICAAVMVIREGLRQIGGKSNRGPQSTRWRGSGIGDVHRFNGFQGLAKKCPTNNGENRSEANDIVPGTMMRAMNWVGSAGPRKPAGITPEGVHHAEQDTSHCSDHSGHQRPDR